MSDPRKYSPDDDTIVECKTCGRRQHLQFVTGLKNGWSKCCGSTMPIVYSDADIDLAVQKLSKHVYILLSIYSTHRRMKNEDT